MSKGEETRQAIVERGADLASRVGLQALSIGSLASDLHMSKSGLFAHFQSKEALQLKVLDYARARFIEEAVMPALKQPRGEPRVRALVEKWRNFSKCSFSGGCLLIASNSEFDDQEGPIRDMLVQTQQDWIDTLTHAVRIAKEVGHFGPQLDADQFVYRLYSFVLGVHLYDRLLKNPKADNFFHSAFEALLSEARTQTHA